MSDVDDLNRKFGDGSVRFEAGNGGLTRVVIATPQAAGELYLHGAHVTHFHPRAQSEPVLFMASKSFFEPGKPIRGGVPVIFPWFGPRDGDKNAMHGVVRTRPWEVRNIERLGDDVRIILNFASNAETRAIWNNDFELTCAVTVGTSLAIELTLRNTSRQAFTFEDALHTYYRVGDVRRAETRGLTGATYIDKLATPEPRVDPSDPLVLTGSTDRVYLNTAGTCTIEDPVLRRRIVIEREGSNSTVVWNAWSDKIGGFVDMSPEDWPKYLCIETCNVRDNAIRLAPGESHTMTARISVENL